MTIRNRGDGSPLTYGRPGVKGDLCVPAHSVPTVVDWDDDGRPELLVGSVYVDAGIYLYRIVDFDDQGTPILGRGEQLGSVDSQMRISGLFGGDIQAVDFNGNGLFDILSCYTFLTHSRDPTRYVHLYTNEGSKGQPKFGPPTRLEADGKVIDTSPAVHMVDWDGDGLKDLLLTGFGHSDPAPTDSKGVPMVGLYDHLGNCLTPRGHQYVRFYKNIGTEHEPVFTDRGYVMQGEQRLDAGGAVFAADLNGNGLLDLICAQEAHDGRGVLVL